MKVWAANKQGLYTCNNKTVETGNNVAYASDYYPFGESIREFQVGTKGGKYKFTEKERDAESSYDYGACPDREALADRIGGARYYNNKLGVWLSADPLAEKYPGFNPFNYCINNPLRLVDPTGMSFEDGWTTTYKANWNGPTSQFDESSDRSDAVFSLEYDDGVKGDPLSQEYHINSKSYKNERYAVLGAAAAFAALKGLNNEVEYGCFVVKRSNGFYYTNFTEGAKGHWIQLVDPQPLISLAREIGATALWHQHRDPNLAQSLSGGDVMTQRLTGLNVYATLPNGNIEGFDLSKYDKLNDIKPLDVVKNFRDSIIPLYNKK